MEDIRCESPGFQQVAHEATRDLVIVHHQHPPAEGRVRADMCVEFHLPTAGVHTGVEWREQYGETGTLSGRAVDQDMAAVFMHDAMHRGQSHAAAFACLLGAEKGLEHAFQHFRQDTRAGIAHSQFEKASADRLATAGASGRSGLFAAEGYLD